MYAGPVLLSVTIAAISIAVLIFKASGWVRAVNDDRAEFRDFMQEFRDELRAFRKEMRDEFQTLRKEMRGEFHGCLVETCNGVRETLEVSTKISKDIKEIRTILERLPSAAVSDNSPLHLTDIGEVISDALQARDWAERTAAALGERVKGKRPYEVQDISFEYVKNEFKPTEEQEVEIRTCAYERGVKRDIVLDVLAVELRDALLKDI